MLTDSEEAGALGVEMCAMVGAGVHPSIEAAIAATVRVKETLRPDDGERERLDAAYGHYRRVIQALEGAWEPV